MAQGKPNGNASTNGFYGGPNNPNVYPLDIAYAFWLDGKEYKTEDLSSDGGAVLRRSAQAWEQRACGGSMWCGGPEVCLSSLPLDTSNRNGSLSPTDPRVTQVTTTLVDSGQVAVENYSYDQYNNKTDTYEYDYGSGTAGASRCGLPTDTDLNGMAKVWLAIPPELPKTVPEPQPAPKNQGTVNATFTGVFHGYRSAFGDGGY